MSLEDDPARVHEYLAHRKFSQKIECRRTQQSISFADFGDPEGCPVLFIPSAACSRWSIIPQDQLCRQRGIRLIVVDRPGCGATPMTTVEKRFETSSLHILSVLQHLKINPRHLVTESVGMYYMLHLLTHHSSFFETVPQPAIISPWVPSKETERSMSLVSSLMMSGLRVSEKSSNNHVDLKMERAPFTSPETSTEMTEKPRGLSERLTRFMRKGQKTSISIGDTGEEDGEIWSETVLSIATDYMLAEECQGITQEMMICLNRGPKDTGPEWVKSFWDQLSTRLVKDDSSMLTSIWWGHKDQIVPRKTQLWLNKLIEKKPRLTLKTFDLKEAGHADTLWRHEGLAKVFAMFHFRERVYYGAEPFMPLRVKRTEEDPEDDTTTI